MKRHSLTNPWPAHTLNSWPAFRTNRILIILFLPGTFCTNWILIFFFLVCSVTRKNVYFFWSYHILDDLHFFLWDLFVQNSCTWAGVRWLYLPGNKKHSVKAAIFATDFFWGELRGSWRLKDSIVNVQHVSAFQQDLLSFDIIIM